MQNMLKIVFYDFRAEFETNVRLEKTSNIKDIDNGIISLKREIYKLKDPDQTQKLNLSY
jgi:hypothetical protein